MDRIGRTQISDTTPWPCWYAARRRGETLTQLLTRLDQVIDKALTEKDVYADEINPPSSHS
jgi:hypothetical protein